jgi:hypothetical protein
MKIKACLGKQQLTEEEKKGLMQIIIALKREVFPFMAT